MKIPLRKLILPLISIALAAQVSAQVQYRNHSAVLQRAEALSKEYPALC
ncbi:MAG: hypothetical protein HZB98_07315, partial [Bacteroidia bacterium]|nr:hypothetical protein [Bacteroidia bacterium]